VDLLFLAEGIPDESFHHPTWGTGFWAVNTDTLRNSVIICALLVLVALVARTRLNPDSPGKLQNVLEFVVEFIRNLIRDTMGNRSITLAPLAITLFVFIFVSNQWGLVPFLKSPTNDVNTCLALALVTFVLTHFYSLKFRGPKSYVSHYFSVVTPKWTAGFGLGALARSMFAAIEILIEFVKPLTLTFRLYFNIFVGELMLALFIFLLQAAAPVALGILWIPFSLFVGLIQAFIFTVLTISYIAQATETHHEGEAGAAH
jgi:F-type H+-transporting ATPase subunit a